MSHRKKPEDERTEGKKEKNIVSRNERKRKEGKKENRNKRTKERLNEKSRKEGNKAGYTAQDAPSMRTFHLRK